MELALTTDYLSIKMRLLDLIRFLEGFNVSVNTNSGLFLSSEVSNC